MTYYGDFPTSHTSVCLVFDSFAAATGAPAATTNFANTDIQIYKNGGTTQRSSANGITVTTSFDTNTGLQMIVIDTSDNTDAGFYAAGNEYSVGVADITVDGQTLRFWVGAFSIERAGGVLALLKAGTAKVDVTKWLTTTVSTPTVAGVPNVNAKTWNDLTTVALPLVPTTAGRTLDVSATGEGGVDWANVGSPTTTLALTGTTIAVTQKVDVDTIKTNPVVNGGTLTFTTNSTVASTAGAVGSVTGAVGSVTGAVGSVTGAVGSVTGAVGSVTGNVSGSIGSLAAQAQTDVKTQAVAALNTDTYAEPGQGAPGATVTLAAKINYLYKFMRNKITQTSTTLSIFADDATTVDQKSTVSDDATTYTRGEIASGP